MDNTAHTEQETDSDLDNRYVIIRLGKIFVAIPVCFVVEMHLLGETTPLPGTPGRMRGVINLRGSAIRVFDLRLCLGMQSLKHETDELGNMLKCREQEHLDWLDELEASVRENRRFALTKDPHACHFGKWYDNYQAPGIILENHLSKFDAPHRAIHKIATLVDGLVVHGKIKEAEALINTTRNNELHIMVELFTQLREILYSTLRETSIVLRYGDDTLIAYSIDQVEAVDQLDPNPYQEELGYSTAFYGQEQRIVVLLESKQLFEPIISQI